MVTISIFICPKFVIVKPYNIRPLLQFNIRFSNSWYYEMEMQAMPLSKIISGFWYQYKIDRLDFIRSFFLFFIFIKINIFCIRLIISSYEFITLSPIRCVGIVLFYFVVFNCWFEDSTLKKPHTKYFTVLQTL